MAHEFRKWIGTSALFVGLAVATGAFGAHLLRGRLDEYSMGVFEKAVFYHALQSLGLLAIAVAAAAGIVPEKAGRRTLKLLAVGIVIFSGSLYALALTGERRLGMITPIGGVCFMLAWFSLAFSLLRNNSAEHLTRTGTPLEGKST